MILKNLTKNYTTIPNELIIDSLSHGAVRLYCYLASKPENWEVYNNDIKKQLNIGRDGLAKYWKELINAGWVEKYPEKDENGKFTGKTILILNNSKNTEKTESGKKPNSVKYGKRDFTESGETQPLNNTIPINKTNINNKTKRESKKETSLFCNLDISEKNYKYLTQDILYMLKELKDKGRLIEDFIKYRKEINKPIRTNRPIKAYLRELIRAKKELGIEMHKAAEIMQENEWQTLKMEWLDRYFKTDKSRTEKKEEKLINNAKKAIDDFVNDK